jgi:membrane-bound lytic murein transglycosylase D
MKEQESTQSPRRAVQVALDQQGAPTTILRFDHPFTIGSDPKSDIAIKSSTVSPTHAEVVYEDDCWWIRPAEGSKGVLLDGKPVEAVPLATGTRVTLGPNGPTLSFTVESPPSPEGQARRKLRLPDHIRKVVRASTRIISVEEHKEILRQMIGRVKRLQSRRYVRIIAVVAVIGIAAAGYAYYKHVQYQNLESRAEDFFYEMKSLELALSRLESRLATYGDSTGRAEVDRARGKLEKLSARYDKYIDELGIYGEGKDEKTRAIYRVARIFGECEVTMPKGFAEEVERYIHEWKLSARLETSLQKAKERGYVRLIGQAMLDQHLPPQFLYVALQESGFDSTVCGPRTRSGIAKGMWQFMPTTAREYGLRTGPLIEIARPDPRDDRHKVKKSTLAASKYIRDIYETEAQASGLLVLASYNWGHSVVGGLIRGMPENPRERNFWAFLKAYKSQIPKQTYDYVYLIFSAAVIGENPKLFGFDFDKPIDDQSL